MKRASVWGVVAVLAMLVAVILASHDSGVQPTGGAAALPWERDLPTALTRASGEGKLVMVDFYTDWCQWCKRMDQNTFTDVEVQRALQGVVTVRLNAEKEGREDAARFNVEGFPTLIFLDSRGAEVGRIPGYMEPRPFLDELHNILQKA
ncbi:MAG TPA: thioredoxin fold domain-containing protein [Thermoanaerobaculaceae bacterium]|nr:thioredoxin fold domain-containing protein [Thermoanaerobaculaceae bacterium]